MYIKFEKKQHKKQSYHDLYLFLGLIQKVHYDLEIYFADK